MAYRTATDEEVESFRAHGWLVVEGVIDLDDLKALEVRCQQIIDQKETLASDWTWETGTSRDDREFKILQSFPTALWPELNDTRFRAWAIAFGSALMGEPVEFWYDQFLAKPPGKSAPTQWHQDEAYWGRNLDDRGITCWMPFHDVDVSNGCMHFVDGGHREGVLEHRHPENLQSDLLVCEPDESRAVATPVVAGGVTFHHSKTPHMTTANQTGTWRRVLTQHLKAVGSPGEGDHYPWKVVANQFAGLTSPPTEASQ